ncbi:hypothetical protein SAMN05216326_1651 [Nitrosomonas marina]|uniref:Uncharacterized protein n=1 Tax=Nitrosomonas marina TaxID=917 RepID=A0A1I0GF16_9PROT|nr:hypothetical protein [Nitrosomonas marina]SET68861.1 hypothetical protein SAMN05216326_1651 [Nitrosomonas marina]
MTTLSKENILYGELVKGCESVQIQQVEGGWKVIRLSEGKNEGEVCLRKKQSYCIGKDQFIDYFVYWKYTDNGYQPDSYRFVGFR